MDPVTLILVPGLLGGLVLALLFAWLRQRRPGSETPPDAFRNQPLSTDVINMAHIRVAGIGGLGLVAGAVWVALAVPRIGQTLAVGLVFGVLIAVMLILRRRKHGAMPSSGRSVGANTTLSIESPTHDVPGESDRFSKRSTIPVIASRPG